MIAASEAGDVETVTELDLAFHGRVVELSGLQYLRRLWTSIDGLVRLRASRRASATRAARLPPQWLVEPSLEHRDLAAALRSRKPAAASRAARRHIENALKRIQAEPRG